MRGSSSGRRSRAGIAPAAAVLGVGFFVLYATRLCRDLCVIGDSAELVTAAAVWGVPHPPGYPLFTTVGHAFTALPGPSLPWDVHLTSAVFHAGAVAATSLAAFTVTRDRVAAIAAGCALGMSRSFVLGSLYAEVFPLNDFFFALLLAMALGARRAATRPGRTVLAFAAVAGLASAHHMMIALAAPALAVLVLGSFVAYARAGPRRAFELVVAFAVPLVVTYALVPLAAAREPYLSWGDVHDVGSLLRLVTRQDYGGLWSPARSASGESGPARVAAFTKLVVRSMGAPTVAVALAGVVERCKRSPAVGASLALGALVSGPAFAWANALDTRSEEMLAHFERFTTMAHVPLAIAFGAAVARARSALGGAEVLAREGRARRGGVRWIVAHALTAALVGWVAWGLQRARDVDLARDRWGPAFAHDLVLGTPDDALLLLSGDVPTAAADYVCAVERRCAGRTVLAPGTLSMPWKMAQTRRRHPEMDIPWSVGPALKRTHELVAAEGVKRPVFVHPSLLEKDSELLRTFEAAPDRLLYRVWPVGVGSAGPHAAFLASARAMAAGECQGCGMGGTIAPRPSEERQVALAYRAAFVNHARTAGRLAGDDGRLGGPAWSALVSALEARARSFDPDGPAPSIRP